MSDCEKSTQYPTKTTKQDAHRRCPHTEDVCRPRIHARAAECILHAPIRTFSVLIDFDVSRSPNLKQNRPDSLRKTAAAPKKPAVRSVNRFEVLVDQDNDNDAPKDNPKRPHLTSSQMEATAVQQGIHIQPTTTDHLLDTMKLEHHSFELQEDKPLRVVSRGLPIAIQNAEMEADLRSKNVPITSARSMTSLATLMARCKVKHLDNNRNMFFLLTWYSQIMNMNIELPTFKIELSQLNNYF